MNLHLGRLRRYWAPILGYGIGGSLLAVVLSRVRAREFGDALLEADYSLVALGASCYFLVLLVRTFRWQYLLRPLATFSMPRLYHALVLGSAANNVFPLRAGELIRSYKIARGGRIHVSTALAVVLAERLADFGVLLGLLLVATLVLPEGLATAIPAAVRSHRAELAAVLAVVAVLGVGFAWLAESGRLQSMLLLRLIRPAGSRWPTRARELVLHLLEGVYCLVPMRRLAWILVLTLLVWAVEVFVYLAVAMSFGLDTLIGSMPQLVIVLLIAMSASNLAMVVPSAQAGLGTFEFVNVGIMTAVGIPVTTAFAYTIVVHFCLAVPVVLLAGVLQVGRQASGKTRHPDGREVASDAHTATSPDQGEPMT